MTSMKYEVVNNWPNFFYALQRRKEERDRANRYTNVMRSLVWRYVSSMHRKVEESPVTEDDINEVKGEISTMRYELLEVFEKNGMDVSSADRKEKSKRDVHTRRFLECNFLINEKCFNSCSCKEDEDMGTTFDEGLPCCAS